MLSRTALALLLSADLSLAQRSVPAAAAAAPAATAAPRAVLASASALATPNAVRAVPRDSKGVDSEKNRQNGANKLSPYDSAFDEDRKVDNDEVYHAPKQAPGSGTAAAASAVEVELATGKPVGKGSLILEDYNPDRLGVDAGAHRQSTEHRLDASDPVEQNKASNAQRSQKSAAAAAAEAVADTDLRVVDTGKKEIKGQDVDARELIAGVRGAPTDDTAKPVAGKSTGGSEKPAGSSGGSSSSGGSEKHSTSTTDKKDSAKIPAGDAPRNTKFGRFIGSAVMIIVSEIGDKTFFIAALMAMRHPPLFVFSSSYTAMVFMTVLSMVLGLILPSLLSRKVTTLLAALLFVVFGLRMVFEAYGMDKSLAATDEMEEVENDIALRDSSSAMEKAESGGALTSDDSPTRKLHQDTVSSVLSQVLSPVWIQIFAMTFLGEWGDRSQIATVAMGAGEGWFEVLFGCLLGHFATTVIAVLGGKILAQHLSLRTITFSGALCFLMFGVFYFRDWLNEQSS